MFWFIPLIASAVSGKMQENNKRAGQNMQNSQNYNRGSSTGLYNNLIGNTNNTNYGQSKLYDAIMDKTNVQTSNPDLSFTGGDTSTGNSMPSSDTNSGLSSLGGEGSGGGGGAGGWMSLANSMMGMMSSNKTPQFEFRPTAAEYKPLETNFNNNNNISRFSDIWKQRRY